MAPRNGSAGRADQSLERVQHFNLIWQGLLDGPPRGGVRRTAQGVAARQQVGTGDGIADVLGWIRKSGNDISVTVQNERSVPVGRNLNQVGRSVGEFTFIGFNP